MSEPSAFSSLVISLSYTAMGQLGKIVNPVTKKLEVDLPGAQTTIDLLSVLQEKTRGNLTEDEDKLLRRIVGDLQLNYLETAKDQKPAAAEEAKPADEA
ncbi:MAG: DUF1844 domain-containing protein [Kiritimatiellae bacterium]|nr:DUF1844 domain-containing protein [Kiritimatiellia bacterium]